MGVNMFIYENLINMYDCILYNQHATPVRCALLVRHSPAHPTVNKGASAYLHPIGVDKFFYPVLVTGGQHFSIYLLKCCKEYTLF